MFGSVNIVGRPLFLLHCNVGMVKRPKSTIPLETIPRSSIHLLAFTKHYLDVVFPGHCNVETRRPYALVCVCVSCTLLGVVPLFTSPTEGKSVGFCSALPRRFSFSLSLVGLKISCSSQEANAEDSCQRAEPDVSAIGPLCYGVFFIYIYIFSFLFSVN